MPPCLPKGQGLGRGRASGLQIVAPLVATGGDSTSGNNSLGSERFADRDAQLYFGGVPEISLGL